MPWTNDKYISKFKFKDDKEQNRPFTAERLDEAVTDIAEGISQTLHVGGDNYMKAPLKMNGNKITGLAPGVNVSDAATVGQASGGGVFAVDNSTDPAKIDLTQIPLKTVTEYKDGLEVTFRVRNNSVANMQVQLNELGYISLDKAGIGSFIQGDIKTLQFIDNVFVCINSENTRMRIVDKNTVPDLNDVTEPCKFALVAIGVANVPTSSWGFVTVKGKGTNSYVEQTYGTHDNNTYKRVKIDQQPWQPWRKLITDYEFNQILSLSKAGTKNGLFKFTPSKGVLPSRNLLDFDAFKPLAVDIGVVEYYWDGELVQQELYYYSTLINENIKNYQNAPPIDTNLWFYLIRFDVWEKKPTGLVIGYLKNNNPNNIFWIGGTWNVVHLNWTGWSPEGQYDPWGPE